MVRSEVKLGAGNGLHARPASMLTKVAAKFDANVKLVSGEKKVDCKSIIGILSLGATEGTSLFVEADGSQANDVVEAIKELFNNNFNE
ncbi:MULTISPECIES: HPr family phosphocarrier protein [unclassified Fusibacter]|uniref:HPr family phosphocarrier protein n=1 Tax=unclassified Fusibacter TaxID=2624464 RepID=UPI001012B450|nr:MULTISPECIES: HPr family phosphocarrier protein [unclassified Fusibacter]MCK8058586.1 HPr family phosphocarrier protein [Fusibacter sp. A2]NPE22644.1 HPr family phosphocarrier protein [Fusibacter sp. A1]RXV60208.1 HPr family phosphocarrier protein [Fusibacter sp. A1]